MREIKKNITIETTKYEAYDGRVFDNEYECNRYENKLKSREQAEIEANNLKKKLAKEYDIGDNPKFDKCWRLALDYANTYGLCLEDVEVHFADFVELIK